MFPALRNAACLRPLIRHIQKDQLQPLRLRDPSRTRCFGRSPPCEAPGLRSLQQRRHVHHHRGVRHRDVARQAEQPGNMAGPRTRTEAVYERVEDRLVLRNFCTTAVLRVGPDRLITSVLSRLSPLVTGDSPLYSPSPSFLLCVAFISAAELILLCCVDCVCDNV